MQSTDEFFEALTAAQLAILEKLSAVEQLTGVCTNLILMVVLLDKVVIAVLIVFTVFESQPNSVDVPDFDIIRIA